MAQPGTAYLMVAKFLSHSSEKREVTMIANVSHDFICKTRIMVEYGIIAVLWFPEFASNSKSLVK